MSGPGSTARFGRAVAAAVIAVVGVAAATTVIVAETRHPASSPAGRAGEGANGPGAASQGSAPDPASPSATPAGQPGTTAPARTLEELEARWAANRARVVATLSAPGYGVGPDNILRGPGGLSVDLNTCPAGWSNTEGLTGTTITLGRTTAQTGALAGLGQYAAGEQAYIDEVNAAGGVGGRQIKLIVADDGGVDTRTAAAVAGLRGTEHAFAVSTTGTSSLAAREALGSACVPQPFVLDLAPSWADPGAHPWTSGLGLPYNVEAGIWGAWIQQRLATTGPVMVAALVSDDPIGRLYQQTFQAWADRHPDVVARFVPVTHAPNASSVSAQMATVTAANPDVFISMTVNRPCLLAVQAANDTGLARSAKALLTPSRCATPVLVMQPGGATANWHTVTDGLKAADDPRYATDPYLAWVTRTLRQRGLEPADKLVATGFGHIGWAQVEALRIAADLPGGLTRTNLVLALHGLALQHPMAYDGVAFATNGTTDPYPLEGAEVQVYDPAAAAWKPDGPAVDVNGTTTPCAWSAGRC